MRHYASVNKLGYFNPDISFILRDYLPFKRKYSKTFYL